VAAALGGGPKGEMLIRQATRIAARCGGDRPTGREPRTAPPPDTGSLLDEAFGNETG
jgi:hypothetical protein